VSFDTAEENRAFSDKFSFNFPLICDVSRNVGICYGAADDANAPMAKRVGVVIDPNGKIKEWLPKVDAASYPTDVLARI
jgi:peroxiredoxin Q/BCP